MDDLPATGPAVPRASNTHRLPEVLLHELRTPLTVVVLRLALLRRRVRRGDGHDALEAELDRIDATLGQLIAAIARFDDARRRPGADGGRR
jgi:signal transduction histidine kinase